MSIKDMVSDIEQEAKNEVEAGKNRAKAESAKILMSKADYFESFYKDKIEKLTFQLNRKEITLKAEKDFIHRNKILQSEDKFARSLVATMRKILLDFIVDNPKEYESIFVMWLDKSIEFLGEKNLVIILNPRDKKYAEKKQSILYIKEDSFIEGGFVLSTENGTKVDVSFQTLFEEKQSYLQSLVLQALKENM